MPFYADLHLHSRYARATSRNADLPELAWWARRKGITVLGTGDFTHPAWFQELKEGLEPAEPGLFRLGDDLDRAVTERLPRSCRGPLRFLLTTEVSTAFRRDGRARRMHHLLYVPGLDGAAALTDRLGRNGNLAEDGRPTLAMDARDLLEATLASGDGAYLVPAHVWTPWVGALSATTGFDSIEACYGELARHIFAVETGLSAAPPMHWRVSAQDRFRVVSYSDAHAPSRLGREATELDTDLDYAAIRRALETGEGFGGTVELFPEAGRYHLSGHRRCGVALEPAEARKAGMRCPVCGKRLTMGCCSGWRTWPTAPTAPAPTGPPAAAAWSPCPSWSPRSPGSGRPARPCAGPSTPWSSGSAPSCPSWSGCRWRPSATPASVRWPRRSARSVAARSCAPPASTASTGRSRSPREPASAPEDAAEAEVGG